MQTCNCKEPPAVQRWTLHLFAREHGGVTEPRKDWPLGPALRSARQRAGISAREAARRTGGAISSGRWYQLETGWQKNKGQLIPIGTTPVTVSAAARAVGWDESEALEIAGFSDYTPERPLDPLTPLSELTDDELLGEIRRRMEARHELEAAPQSGAQGTEDENARAADGRRKDEDLSTADQAVEPDEDDYDLVGRDVGGISEAEYIRRQQERDAELGDL